MNSAIRKIVTMLLLVMLLPVIFFSLYELNQLSENFVIIQSIYSRQLESILFSVNQVSDDLVSSWTRKVNSVTSENIPLEKMNLREIIGTNPSIYEITALDSAGNIVLHTSRENFPGYFNKSSIKYLLKSNAEKVEKLFSYKKAGYSKIWNIDHKGWGKNSIFMFLCDTEKNDIRMCFILFNTDIFIKEILSPTLLNEVKQEFIISIINKSGMIEYTTEPSDKSKFDQTKSLWLLPDYKVGIKLKGETIESVVENRARFNLFLIIGITIVIVIGFWFVFRSIKKEVELAQIKSDFVSNVSHELRTPLALITMFAETLELNRVKSEDKKKEYYTIISKEANRLSLIVNKILNFSKVEAGKIKYHFETANLNSIADDIYENYSFHLKNSGFKFSNETAAGMPDVQIDCGAVKEAVINLIDNAVKYSAENKDVKLRTIFNEDSAAIEVTDNGIGIAEPDQKKIFEKFYRVHTGLVHNVKGTGLGLSLVQHIMNVHNGKITLKSALGEGSTFRLIFPLNNKKIKGDL